MNDRLQAELQTRIQTFAADVTGILQRAVSDAVGSALSSQRAGGERAQTKRNGRGTSRSAEGRQTTRFADGEALLSEVTRKGGRRIEELARSMRTTTRALTPAMKKLLEAKKVKRTGKARGTKYTAG